MTEIIAFLRYPALAQDDGEVRELGLGRVADVVEVDAVSLGANAVRPDRLGSRADEIDVANVAQVRRSVRRDDGHAGR